MSACIESQKIISAAISEFSSRGLNLSKYKIVVEFLGENRSSATVSFLDPDRPAAILGGSPFMPEFEVVIDLHTMTVTSSHYVR
jgi:hypothetical protein